jgi:dolichol-phosphate hexosyltransferase
MDGCPIPPVRRLSTLRRAANGLAAALNRVQAERHQQDPNSSAYLFSTQGTMVQQPPAPRRRFVRRPSVAPSLSVVPITAAASRHHSTAEESRAIKLSILMPAYNEQATIAHVIHTVLTTDYPCEFELIVVDDGSTDATPEILAELDHPHARVYRHPRNMGKGAALLTAASLATGSHIVPFDADLEYAPDDLARMLEPVLAGRCDVVYGARLFGVNTVYQSYTHAVGNRALTLAANVMFDSYLSDLHTCLKLLPLDLFNQLELRETGFGLDTEITAKMLKLGVRPFEVPISYHSRSVAQGKKIGWQDGVECLQVLTRVRFRGRRRQTGAGTFAPATATPVVEMTPPVMGDGDVAVTAPGRVSAVAG